MAVGKLRCIEVSSQPEKVNMQQNLNRKFSSINFYYFNMTMLLNNVFMFATGVMVIKTANHLLLL